MPLTCGRSVTLCNDCTEPMPAATCGTSFCSTATTVTGTGGGPSAESAVSEPDSSLQAISTTTATDTAAPSRAPRDWGNRVGMAMDKQASKEALRNIAQAPAPEDDPQLTK